MNILQINAMNGYRPRPDFELSVHEDGTVRYSGRYYVGVVGDRVKAIGVDQLSEIRLLTDFLVKRNQKNYLIKDLNPIFKVRVGDVVQTSFEIDHKDVVSEDIIKQIIDLSGAGEWLKANLDLYLVMSKSKFRSKELALIRAADSGKAVSMYLESRSSRIFKSENDFISLKLGKQKPGSLVNPVIYFSFLDYQIQKDGPSFWLNQGPILTGRDIKVFLFISFGKRYNDPKASYFIVLARDKESASAIFGSTYPHFMPHDFQQVDLDLDYVPNPLFESHIPMAIR